MDQREEILDKLGKLLMREDVKRAMMPAGECKNAGIHLLGLYVRAHAGAILEALRRAD